MITQSVITLAAATLMSSAAGAGPFSMSEPSGDDLVTVSLALEHGTLRPGETETLAVTFDIEPAWHIYWRNSGDTGLPPLVTLDLPDGVEAGAIQWPTPQWYEHGGLLDFIYERQVTLLIPLAVDESLNESTVAINVEADWLVCQEACLPGAGSASLSVVVGQPQSPNSEAAQRIAQARSSLPQPHENAKRAGVRHQWDGTTLVMHAPNAQRLRFFPYAPQRVPPNDTLRDGAIEGDRIRIEFDDRIRSHEQVAGVLEVQSETGSTFYDVQWPGP